jgi:hypothetical protein
MTCEAPLTDLRTRLHALYLPHKFAGDTGGRI